MELTLNPKSISEKDPIYNMFRKDPGMPIHRYTVFDKEFTESSNGSLDVPFHVHPSGLVIPSSQEGRFWWLRFYNSWGNDARFRAMQILAMRSGEDVYGSDGYKSAVRITAMTDVEAFGNAWRRYDSEFQGYFHDTPQLERAEWQRNQKLADAIKQYREAVKWLTSLGDK